MKPFCYLSVLLLAMVAADTPRNISSRQAITNIDPNDDPQNIPEWIEASNWPPKKNYTFDNPMIEDLNGQEEPLKTFKLMPYKLELIGTRFQLFATWAKTPYKYLFPLSYNNQSSLDAFPTAKCPKLYVFIHGGNANITEKDGCLDRVNANSNANCTKREGCLKSVMESILCYEENACLIAVDWSRGAAATLHAAVFTTEQNQLYPPLVGLYKAMAVNTIVVGRQTAFLLYLLVTERKIKAENIHVMGHSLGGRIIHVVGEYYTRLIQREKSKGTSRKPVNPGNVPEKLGRITGLDIAGPLFDDIPGGFLSKNDGTFVDLIHTTGGDPNRPVGVTNVTRPFVEFGSRFAVGHVDFYPNDAQARQADCDNVLEGFLNTYLLGYCSHSKSTEYMADSFNKTISRMKFRSVNCSSYAMLDQCMAQASPSSFGFMGKGALEAPGRGVQFLRYSRKKSSSGYH